MGFHSVVKSLFGLGFIVCLLYIGISQTAVGQAVSALPQADTKLFLPLLVKPTGPEYKIVYESEGDLYMMNMQGTNKVNITNTPAITETHPVWSPDGANILFPHSSNVYKVRVSDGQVDNLTEAQTDDYASLHWSADGLQIVCMVYDYDDGINAFSYTDIVVMNADGSGLINLTNSDSVRERFPSISPIPIE